MDKLTQNERKLYSLAFFIRAESRVARVCSSISRDFGKDYFFRELGT